MDVNNSITKESPILVAGASVRALAWSAARGGFSPWALDLFQDQDLVNFFPGQKILQQNDSTLFDQILNAPDGPLVYTGGLENHPNLLEKIKKTRPVWGITGKSLNSVRDPFQLQKLIEKKGIITARVEPASNNPTGDCAWLVKPIQHAGGRNISTFPSKDMALQKANYFLQEWISGEPRSAVFLITQSGSELIGITKQLTGWQSFHAGPFQFSGSIGPLFPGPTEKADLLLLGKILFEEAGCKGILGFDYVLNQGRAVPIEINPRYSASVELLEWGLGESLLNRHAAVFFPGIERNKNILPIKEMLGKGVYFAPKDFNFPEKGMWGQGGSPWEFPEFADIPWPNSPQTKGQPVMSFYAKGYSVEDLRNKLEKTANDLDNYFFPNGTMK